MEKSARLSYLDNLRSFVIFLVVVMHSNVTYSGMGSWYYVEGSPGRNGPLSQLLFGLYGSFTQAWFMGALFFVAGFFAAGSLARHGAARFVTERLFRLGVPLLVYVFVITPFIAYFLMDYGQVRERFSLLQAYAGYLSSFQWVGSTGPLWFVEALLLFTLPYVLYRLVRPLKTPASGRVPRTGTILLLIVITAVVAFVIRLVQPIGTAILNLQFSFFASYVVLFLVGLHAGEQKWLTEIPKKTGMRWFTVVLAAGIPLWLVLMIAAGARTGAPPIGGGWTWPTAAYALWESFVAIGFTLGLVVFFRTFLDRSGAVARLLSRNSFGVYTFHAPVLIALSLSLAAWSAPPLVKHVVVAPTAYLATLALSELILRRIPGLKQVLK